MIAGIVGVLGLILFFVSTMTSLNITENIGLFSAGTLQEAGTTANFSPEVQQGFTDTTTSFITNVSLVDRPIQFMSMMMIIIAVLSIFGFAIVKVKNYYSEKDGF